MISILPQNVEAIHPSLWRASPLARGINVGEFQVIVDASEWLGKLSPITVSSHAPVKLEKMERPWIRVNARYAPVRR